jgi:Tripartite tricarboxylate transporter family receptor
MTDAAMTSANAETAGSRARARALRHFVAIAGVIVAICLPRAPANAQDWPRKPVRIVSPFAAGGSSDTMGRIVAENLSQRMHQQFYIENRGGAGGLIGSAAVANSPPDGTTFLISSIGTHVIAPATSANPGYDPIGSFTHVAFVGGPPTYKPDKRRIFGANQSARRDKRCLRNTTMTASSLGPTTAGSRWP